MFFAKFTVRKHSSNTFHNSPVQRAISNSSTPTRRKSNRSSSFNSEPDELSVTIEEVVDVEDEIAEQDEQSMYDLETVEKATDTPSKSAGSSSKPVSKSKAKARRISSRSNLNSSTNSPTEKSVKSNTSKSLSSSSPTNSLEKAPDNDEIYIPPTQPIEGDPFALDQESSYSVFDNEQASQEPVQSLFSTSQRMGLSSFQPSPLGLVPSTKSSNKKNDKNNKTYRSANRSFSGSRSSNYHKRQIKRSSLNANHYLNNPSFAETLGFKEYISENNRLSLPASTTALSSPTSLSSTGQRPSFSRLHTIESARKAVSVRELPANGHAPRFLSVSSTRKNPTSKSVTPVSVTNLRSMRSIAGSDDEKEDEEKKKSGSVSFFQKHRIQSINTKDKETSANRKNSDSATLQSVANISRKNIESAVKENEKGEKALVNGEASGDSAKTKTATESEPATMSFDTPSTQPVESLPHHFASSPEPFEPYTEPVHSSPQPIDSSPRPVLSSPQLAESPPQVEKDKSSVFVLPLEDGEEETVRDSVKEKETYGRPVNDSSQTGPERTASSNNSIKAASDVSDSYGRPHKNFTSPRTNSRLSSRSDPKSTSKTDSVIDVDIVTADDVPPTQIIQKPNDIVKDTGSEKEKGTWKEKSMTSKSSTEKFDFSDDYDSDSEKSSLKNSIFRRSPRSRNNKTSGKEQGLMADGGLDQQSHSFVDEEYEEQPIIATGEDEAEQHIITIDEVFEKQPKKNARGSATRTVASTVEIEKPKSLPKRRRSSKRSDPLIIPIGEEEEISSSTEETQLNLSNKDEQLNLLSEEEQIIMSREEEQDIGASSENLEQINLSSEEERGLSGKAKRLRRTSRRSRVFKSKPRKYVTSSLKAKKQKSGGSDHKKENEKENNDLQSTEEVITIYPEAQDSQTETQNLSNVRRSSRIRMPPLQFWRNERIIYTIKSLGNTKSPQIEKVIQRPEPAEPTMKRRKSQNMRSKNSIKRQKTLRYGQVYDLDEEDFADNELATETILKSADQVVFSNSLSGDVQTYSVENTNRPATKHISVAWGRESDNFQTIPDTMYRISPMYSDADSGAACGMLEFEPEGEKPFQSTQERDCFFHVISGAFKVAVADTTFTAVRGGTFVAPKGNVYSIKNLLPKPSRLFFVYAKDTRFERENMESYNKTAHQHDGSDFVEVLAMDSDS